MSYADFFSIEVTQMRSNKKRIIGVAVSLLIVAGIICTCAVVAASSLDNKNDMLKAGAVTKAIISSTSPVVPNTEPDIKPYIVPGDMTGLKVSNAEQGKIKLSWNKAFNASQYIVYRAGETSGGMGELKAYKTVSGTSFTDTVDAASCYKYKVEPVRNSLGETQRGKSAEYSVMSRPEAVTGLGMPDKKLKSVTLSWNKASKATSYEIYRADEGEKDKFGEFKKVASTANTTFKDTGLSSGKLYRYKVCAKRSFANTSCEGEADEYQALTSIRKPKELNTGKTTLTSIALKWKKNPKADKYEILKGKKTIATVSGNTYTDKGLKHSTVYKYSVRAARYVDGKLRHGRRARLTASTNVKVPYVKSGMSGTWIMVNISTQTLTMYVDNKPYVTTPVVTGNVGDRATTKGFHRVISRKSPAVLKGSYGGSSWNTTVSYWLGFTYSGQGVHDSTWRSSYGGKIYQYNGSHGCVNTPLAAVAKIYQKAYVGMPVIVY